MLGSSLLRLTHHRRSDPPDTKILLTLNQLYIQVKNSGQYAPLPASKRREEEGHGIDNTQQRLALLYGEKASFRIFNSGTQFVITEIKIPKQRLTLD